MSRVIEFLRGSRNAYILSRKYDTLKTYGVGQDMPTNEWQWYIIQLLNL